MYFGVIAPPVGAVRVGRFGGDLLQVGGQIGVHVLRHGQVAGQDVVENGVIGRALDVRLAAQGVDAAAGDADVAEEQLQHGVGAHVLGAVGVLRRAHGVHDRRRAVRAAGGAEGAGHRHVGLDVGAGDLAHHHRGVAAVVLFQQLVDAARVLQTHVAQGAAVLAGLVFPGVFAVAEVGGVIAAEQPFGKGEAVVDDEGGVGVIDDVILLDQVVFQDVVDQAADEGDVGPRPQLGIDIGLRGGPGVARVDADQLGAVVHRPLHIFEGDRMVFSRVGTDAEDDIRMLDVVPVVGHCTTTEGGRQTGNRSGVSYSRLVFEVADPHGAGKFAHQVAFLIIQGGGAEHRHPFVAVDDVFLAVALFGLHEIAVAGFLHQLGDALHRPVPRFLFPLIGARRPVAYLLSGAARCWRPETGRCLWSRGSRG